MVIFLIFWQRNWENFGIFFPLVYIRIILLIIFVKFRQNFHMKRMEKENIEPTPIILFLK
jgi:hypothetical protein